MLSASTCAWSSEAGGVLPRAVDAAGDFLAEATARAGAAALAGAFATPLAAPTLLDAAALFDALSTADADAAAEGAEAIFAEVPANLWPFLY